ncbi:type II toxin-antitoxin system RelE/ParE family toxin [Kaistella sp.]|uniref:type II toxin-antitoxin system RelE/ParE family toxin n=1 Tax=Kaistella sp. TaxID=2782235 RepID=UPI0035A12913
MRKDYFRSRIKSHFLFYKINAEKEEVEIITILHQKMDTDSPLKKLTFYSTKKTFPFREMFRFNHHLKSSLEDFNFFF